MASSYRIKGTVLVEEATTNYLGVDNSVLDLGLVVTRASTKVESHASFTEPQKVSQPIIFICLFFCNVKHLSSLVKLSFTLTQTFSVDTE